MEKKFIYLTLVIGSISLAGCQKQETTYPVQKDIIDAVFASGYISTTDEYLVTANAEGYLSEARVQEVDSVLKGTPLFKLSSEKQSAQLATARANYEDARSKLSPGSPQIAQRELQIEQAKTQLQLDEKNFQRYARLVESKAVSQLDYEKAKLQYEASKNNLEILKKSFDDFKKNLQLNLENAENQLKIQQENASDYFLISAIDGQVLNVYKNPGELVGRGQAIAKIGGGDVFIKLYVAEEDISRIKLHQKTLISLNTDKDKVFEAYISKIYPAFDEQDQSFIAEATFTDKPERIFPGTQLQANIIIGKKEKTLIIPSAYLLKGDSVWVDSNQKVPVQIGIKNGEWVEIVSGIDTSNRIVLKK